MIYFRVKGAALGTVLDLITIINSPIYCVANYSYYHGYFNITIFSLIILTLDVSHTTNSAGRD